jgi:hypothetical protein
MIRSLYQYRKIAAGAITRQVLFQLDDQVNECELYYTTDLGVTKTLITDFGAGSINTIFDFATFGDELWMTNGVITPRLWNGASLSAGGATQLAAPTIASGGAGVLLGTYRYRVVPINSDKTRKPGSVTSAVFRANLNSAGVTWVADADGGVVGYEIYRTTGSGLDFYLVTYIDGRTTVTYTDNLSDEELLTHESMSVIASVGDPPPSGAYYCFPHKGRMIWARTDTYPRRFWWSDPGDADSVYMERSFSECTDSKSLGDQLTGGVGDYEGMFVLFLEKSIWTVSGTGTILGGAFDWRKRRSNAKTGTHSSRTVARVSAGSSYLGPDGNTIQTPKNMLAYLTPRKDIRLFDGSNDYIISNPKRDTLARLNLSAANKAFVFDDEDRQMLCWVFPIDSSTEPNYTVAWNYQLGTWHEWSGTSFGHVVAAEDSTSTVLLAGEALKTTGAFVYKLWNGNNRDGASITSTFMSKAIYPPVDQTGLNDFTQEKRLESIILMFEKDGTPTTVTVGFLPHDAADSDSVSFSKSVSATSRVKVQAQQGASDPNPGKFHFGVGWRLKVTSTVTSGPWILDGIQSVYVPLAGKTR